MKQEGKQLLLKDLCARLPYGVICHYNCVIPCGRRVIEKSNTRDVLKGIIPMSDGHIGFMVGIDKIDALEGDIKPYLRPMSSMTEEEIKDYYKCTDAAHRECYEVRANGEDRRVVIGEDGYSSAIDLDWLNSHHFDYHGLIEKGLALEAPEGMYKNE